MSFSHVAFGLLYQGGIPPEGDELRSQGFNLLVLCAEEHQPDALLFSGVRVVLAPFEDRPIKKRDLAMALEASRIVAEALLHRQKVLVTCQMGLNRSGLVTALALRRLGVSPQRAVWLVRKARGQWALSNQSFEDEVFGAYLPRQARKR